MAIETVYLASNIALLVAPLLLLAILVAVMKLPLRAVFIGMGVMLLVGLLTAVAGGGLGFLLRNEVAGAGMTGRGLVQIGMLGAVITALFSELGRWLTYRGAMKEQRTWKNAVAFGAGWGALGVALGRGAGGLLQFAGMQMNRNLGAQVQGAELTPEQLEQVRMAQEMAQRYWAAAPDSVWLQAVASLLPFVMHIVLAVVVLQVFRQGGVWLLAAIGWHWLVVSSQVYFGELLSWGVSAAVQAVLALFGLLVVWYLWSPEPDLRAELLAAFDDDEADAGAKEPAAEGYPPAGDATADDGEVGGEDDPET